MPPIVDCGVANFVLPEQEESGDGYLICRHENRVLIAAVDGVGHGEEAAKAAQAAVSLLKERPGESIVSLVEQCHAKLQSMRGVVLSLATIDMTGASLTWLGVGNVEGILMRGRSRNGHVKERLLLRAGLIGSQLPLLQSTVLPLAPGDTVYFVTDGIHTNFAESLIAKENPQKAADRILRQFQKGSDDALVVVARFLGTSQ